ncbi:MAG: GGDEF domain-containing protein [bacterium]
MKREGTMKGFFSGFFRKPERRRPPASSTETTAGHSPEILDFFDLAREKFRLAPRPFDDTAARRLSARHDVHNPTLLLVSDALDPLLLENGVFPEQMLIAAGKTCEGCPAHAVKALTDDNVMPDVRGECAAPYAPLSRRVCLPLAFGGGVPAVFAFTQPAARPPHDARLLDAIGALLAPLAHRELLTELNRLLQITDPLTRVYNYRHFMSLLSTELDRSRRYDHPFTLLMIDMDDFREFNAAHGREAGDLALRETAALIRRSVRSTDTVARYSGGTFAAILPETSLRGAITVAEKIRTMIQNLEIAAEGESAPARVTASGGLAVFPDDSLLISRLISCAEDAVCAAKRAGKNNVRHAGGPP